MGILNVWFLVALMLSILSVVAGLFVGFKGLFVEEMVTGWLIVFFNQGMYWLIRQYNDRKESKQLIMHSLGLNALRVGIFFLTIIGFLATTDFKTAPFVYSLFSTYFIFLIYNILTMQSISLKANDATL